MLFKHNVYSNNDTIDFTNYTLGVAEAEIAFKLSKNISSHSKEIKEIKRYIDCVIIAIELPDTTFNNFESTKEFNLLYFDEINNIKQHKFNKRDVILLFKTIT